MAIMADLALDLACSLDPVILAEQAGIEPDPWQCEVLRSTAPRVLLNCSRQSGKSTISALLALHTALYTPSALVLMLSPSLRQSAELFRKALDLYRALGRPVPAQAETSLRLELEGGSRIISLPGSEATVRGYSSVALLVIDEASRVEDELYTALKPMTAVSQGRLIALSTPMGRRGWWWTAWDSVEDWHRFRVPASECPRISRAFLEQEKRTLAPWVYRQEYECEASETMDQIFGYDVVMGALAAEVAPLFAPASPGSSQDAMTDGEQGAVVALFGR
jgi:hypothetical protein